MAITLCCVGKIKEQFAQEGMAEYRKRLQKYVSLQYVETAALPSVSQLKRFSIALDVQGKELDSEQFAEYLRKKMLEEKNIYFLIGGAEGLSGDLIQHCNDRISLSKMTFPNQLVRLIFLEQLYRAMTIIHHEPYHK